MVLHKSGDGGGLGRGNFGLVRGFNVRLSMKKGGFCVASGKEGIIILVLVLVFHIRVNGKPKNCHATRHHFPCA